MPKSASRKKAPKVQPKKKNDGKKKMSFFQRIMLNRTLTSTKYVRTKRQKSGTPIRYNVMSGSEKSTTLTANPNPLKKSEAKALRNMLNDNPGGGPYRVSTAR